MRDREDLIPNILSSLKFKDEKEVRFYLFHVLAKIRRFESYIRNVFPLMKEGNSIKSSIAATKKDIAFYTNLLKAVADKFLGEGVYKTSAEKRKCPDGDEYFCWLCEKWQTPREWSFADQSKIICPVCCAVFVEDQNKE